MTVAVRPFPVTDFSGGITDNFVNAELRQSEEVDNFLILENKSLIQRPGSTVLDAVNAPIIPNGLRIGTLINYDKDSELFYQAADKLYFRNPDAYSALQGPSGNHAFPTASITNHLAYSEWQKHVFLSSDTFESPKKMYVDGGGNYQLRTAGLPSLASTPTVTPGAAGSRSYLYAFHYHYSYTAGLKDFEDFGPTTVIEVTNSDDPSVNANAISGIPVLANGVSESWDTSNVKVYIFRSVDGGQTLYKIGEVTNGTTVFNDTFADTAIDVNEEIYTAGDVLDNDPPPSCKYVHVVNNIGYYGYIKDGSEELPSLVRQSAPGDPDSVPIQNGIEVRDDIRGLNSVQSIPMVFCRKHIYRIDDVYDELGRGTPSAIIINDTAGCVSNRSIVQAKDYVFWAGNDKFYASDGYKVIPLSDSFNDRYKAMIAASSDAENIVGAYDEKNERIYWSVQTNSSNGDSDTLWVLDLRWGLSLDSTFTSMSGGASFAPSAITFFNDRLIRADKRGYTFEHDDTVATDPKVDTAADPEDWKTQAIVWTYRGPTTNFGTDFLRKWVTRVILTARNLSNVGVQINVINDDGRTIRALQPIRYRKNFVWGDQEFFWRSEDCVWRAVGLIEEMRRMKARGLRCSYMQIEITNADVIIANSDTFGTATVTDLTATSKQVTLDDSVTFDWPDDAEDYFIAFGDDNYTAKYLITDRTDDVITVADPTGSLVSGAAKVWQVSGIRKGEQFNLLGYSLSYLPISQSQSMFEAGQAGENA